MFQRLIDRFNESADRDWIAHGGKALDIVPLNTPQVNIWSSDVDTDWFEA